MPTKSETIKDLVLNNEIIRVTVGSTVHGLAIEGTDDRDEMGVFIEPPEYVCGLRKIEQYVERSQPEGVRSQPGDLDLTIYSLRKWMRLATNGNPSILTLLFVPHDQWKHPHSWLSHTLVELAPAIVSRQAGHRYLCYLRAQRDRLTGARGQARLPSRPELVERYGYDTKYAAHMIRLGFQGIELLKTGRLTLPMPEIERKTCLEIRQGKIIKEAALTIVSTLEERLERLIETSELPECPDYDTVNKALVEMHLEHWKIGERKSYPLGNIPFH